LSYSTNELVSWNKYKLEHKSQCMDSVHSQN
jgi:hypothetical protein